MRQHINLLVLMSCIWSSVGTVRDVECIDGPWFAHGNICCLNCPAGTHVKEACNKTFERSVCQQCDFDTYTEHDNGLFKCLDCSKCRSDQEVLQQCISTRNTHCQCKKGTYCLPDQACEVCKTCRKCKEDEEVVESCTAHSNTVCRKRSSISGTTAGTMTVINANAGAVIAVVAIMIPVIWCLFYWRMSNKFKKAGASRCPREMYKSCKNTTGTGCFLMIARHVEKKRIPRLIPLSDDSLRKSFDLFGDIDIDFQKRFFRLLGLSDNDIRIAEMTWPLVGDKVYELLKIWMQKEGMKADFNSLIDALLTLDQRRSAENIVEKVVSCGYFRYEED